MQLNPDEYKNMTTATHYTGEERRKRIFAIVGASSGNLVEWFDFYVYAFCAIYFAPAFFPSDDPTVQLLNTAGVFAAGFLMRPIGGWLMGFFPIESAITAGLCMANRGGSGDLEVLSACNRMNLISYAQISSRLGGGIVLVIASIVFGMMI